MHRYVEKTKGLTKPGCLSPRLSLCMQAIHYSDEQKIILKIINSTLPMRSNML